MVAIKHVQGCIDVVVMLKIQRISFQEVRC
ncbi:hypothetical protein AF91_00180 [Lacticaseibacillus paracasei N1115]|uniref:Uncharacterized protein n=1 Tax=Lacticaseibacillus paracasei N1115 TaxID=1446494 RepID=A0A806LHV0_LACPA|nr:hypothetical protein AF91_00180 [Lacticaseibacillus paracasei N1115]